MADDAPADLPHPDPPLATRAAALADTRTDAPRPATATMDTSTMLAAASMLVEPPAPGDRDDADSPVHNPWSASADVLTPGVGLMTPVSANPMASVVFPARSPATMASYRSFPDLLPPASATSGAGSAASVTPPAYTAAAVLPLAGDDDPWSTAAPASSSMAHRRLAKPSTSFADPWHQSSTTIGSTNGIADTDPVPTPVNDDDHDHDDDHSPTTGRARPPPVLRTSSGLTLDAVRAHAAAHSPTTANMPSGVRSPRAVPPMSPGLMSPRSTGGAATPVVDTFDDWEDDATWLTNQDAITVTIAPEKGGSLFKHVNYYISSAKQGTTVTRRYSDFLWLHDALLKKYPFRLHLTPPPKKVNAYAPPVADAVFLEKRRRGLQRYLTHLVRHPILGADVHFRAFLTRSEEIATYRKQVGSSFAPEPERQPEPAPPVKLEEQLAVLVPQMEHLFMRYQKLVDRIEAMCTREQEQARDFLTVSEVLSDMGTHKPHCYDPSCTTCVGSADGVSTLALRVERAAHVHEESADAMLLGSVETLKLVRDQVAGLEHLFQRSTKALTSAKATIASLAKRIANNEAKLASTAMAPEPNRDVEDRLRASLVDDQRATQRVENGMRHIHRCLAHELKVWHRHRMITAVGVRMWTKEHARRANEVAMIWRAAEDEQVGVLPDAPARPVTSASAASRGAGNGVVAGGTSPGGRASEDRV
ncbi:Sorting nexin mvp1 [Allomyces arbusculus]|nr:Sorting nexin mvp1 [Allomyces arbusculus]